jgi:hypothetical protein
MMILNVINQHQSILGEKSDADLESSVDDLIVYM